MGDPVHIDGNYGEGGGQVLRASVALSALLGIPIKVTDIRKDRQPKPGLRPQHLTGIQLVAEMFQGRLEGAVVNSSEISFFPGSYKHGNRKCDTGTAGSITLLIQTALPCMIFGDEKSTVTFVGGTNAEKAPQVDYFQRVFGPIASKFGISYDFGLVRRGFYPRGGGEAVLTVEPLAKLQSVHLTEPGTVKSISIYVFVAGNIVKQDGDRMSNAALKLLKERFTDETVVWTVNVSKETKKTAVANGAGILIVLETSTGCVFGGSGLVDKKISPDEAGTHAATELIRDFGFGGCCDEYAQDQAKFTVTEVPEEEKLRPDETTFWIICEGIGFSNPNFP